jgi:hypothetical protein
MLRSDVSQQINAAASCTFQWYEADQYWFTFVDRGGPSWQKQPFTFESFSAEGQELLRQVRTDYGADEAQYRELLAFNDRYTGVERLEKAYAAYKQVFDHDDLAGMIRERPTVLQERDRAKARKQLLTQQSAEITKVEQALADIATAIDREGLTNFADQKAQTSLEELRREVDRLSQTAPGTRGDVSANLEIIATRKQDIDTAVRSAQSLKSQAEQTRKMLVASEGAARRVLDAASSEELNGAFDEEFRNSTNELIKHFGELGSGDLWAIRTRRQEIDTAGRKLGDLESKISDARARYDRAKQLDGERQAMMQKAAGALSEFQRPDIRDKLGNDGLTTIISLKSYQDTLSTFEGARLIDRPDYGDTLVAIDEALTKTQQFKAEMVQVAQLISDLKALNSKIDRRGRQLLDGPTSSAVVDISKSVNALSVAKIPLSPEVHSQFAGARTALSRLDASIDDVMDAEEKRILARQMPSRNGIWRFSFDVDKITDDERVRAFAHVESSQANYQLTVTCGKRGGELVIATFEPVGQESKRIPWAFDLPALNKRIRLRIDSYPAFAASLEMRGYVNQGQVSAADIRAQLRNLVYSSRLVFADVFPDEQVEVATAYPVQFSRLCELLAPR